MPLLREFTQDRLRVCVYSNREEMGAAAGVKAAQTIAHAIAKQDSARIILASAPSQLETLETLVAADLDWSRVTVFHMDEYVGLGADHPASFRAFQQRHVLSRVTPAAFHGIRGEAGDLDAECARYAALLAESPIDLVCLGIGENGHLAFNDPPVADFHDPHAVKVVELDAACRQQQVNDGCFPSLADVPRQALTLTIPVLMSAETVIASVPGARKARALSETLKNCVSTHCPASILRTHTSASLWTDQQAFSQGV